MTDKKFVEVLANCMFSYDVIKRAGTEAQKSDKWAEDSAVQKLKFSNCWVANFLKRLRYSRRKATGVRV